MNKINGVNNNVRGEETVISGTNNRVEGKKNVIVSGNSNIIKGESN